MLPSEKRRLYVERLRQLQRLGLSMPSEYSLLDGQPSEIIVEQCGYDIESLVLDLHDGRSLYLVCLSLAAQRPGLAVYDFRFVPPWRDNEFFTLPAFADSCRGEAYVLPNNWEFPREDILNCNFGKTGWRVPCTRVEGLLCVCSATPIPKEYPHGARIPVTVKFFGKSGRQLAETAVVLWADRWDQRAVRRPATEPSLAAQEHANLSAMVQPLDSDLFEGGKVTDSRAANLLPVKEPRSADRGRRSLDHTDQGRGARGAPDSL